MVSYNRNHFKDMFPFYFKKKLGPEEYRFIEKVDINISDKIKKKSNLFYSTDQSFTKNFENQQGSRILENKSNLISLINSSEQGISVKFLLKSYTNIKDDLIDIVKYREKNRILILIKGKNSGELIIYPFYSKFWIKVSNKLIWKWHKV